MNYFVVIMVIWLAPDGHIVAHNTGFALDVPRCQAIAEKSIANDLATNPLVKGAVPKYACWDTRAPQTRKQESVRLPAGSQWL